MESFKGRQRINNYLPYLDEIVIQYRLVGSPASLLQKGENTMFVFRLINTPDGNQIIDTTLKTPYSSLTPLQMEEYIEMDNQLAYMERMERKQAREADKKAFYEFINGGWKNGIDTK